MTMHTSYHLFKPQPHESIPKMDLRAIGPLCSPFQHATLGKKSLFSTILMTYLFNWPVEDRWMSLTH